MRTALYPLVEEKALRELVTEAGANPHTFQAKVHTVLCESYLNHYRRILPALSAAPEFHTQHDLPSRRPGSTTG
ncbi:hypothetical protein [Actinopolyspora mortivallis]|uniref:hypothetical protein n=1 Tax=Actinopolyspora mortivallis TaxID=33906 RepID=UPI00036BAC81|nr:hypothetical protein [Actinopolyspora mortivallis]